MFPEGLKRFQMPSKDFEIDDEQLPNDDETTWRSCSAAFDQGPHGAAALHFMHRKAGIF